MMIACLGEERIKAVPGAKGTCQSCEKEVVARCGEVNVHHFAHRSKEACEASRYGMTEWHMGWLDSFPKECVEYRLKSGGKLHIADLVVMNRGRKTVIEFQRRLMPAEDMREREAFWKRNGFDYRWVFDGVEAYGDPEEWSARDRLVLRNKGDYHTFKWKQAPGRLAAIDPPYFVDYGRGLLLVRKIYAEDRPFAGWGNLYEYSALHSAARRMEPTMKRLRQ